MTKQSNVKNPILLKWAKQLSDRTGRSVENIVSGGLVATDFSAPGIKIDFEDQSEVHFKWAFCLQTDLYPGIVSVFTEHNGYHEFPCGPDDVITLF